MIAKDADKLIDILTTREDFADKARRVVRIAMRHKVVVGQRAAGSWGRDMHPGDPSVRVVRDRIYLPDGQPDVVVDRFLQVVWVVSDWHRKCNLRCGGLV